MRTERDGNKSSRFPFLWTNGSHGWDCHYRIKAGPHLLVTFPGPFLGRVFRSFRFFCDSQSPNWIGGMKKWTKPPRFVPSCENHRRFCLLEMFTALVTSVSLRLLPSQSKWAQHCLKLNHLLVRRKESITYCEGKFLSYLIFTFGRGAL